MLRQLILVLLFVPTLLFAQTKSIDVTTSEWLSLIDNQHYGESWDSTGSLFRSQISKDEWVAAVSAIRAKVGNLESRSLTTTTSMKSLPNVPDGEYVVIQYQTIFSGKQSTETLTLSKSKTGWVVIGYFINSLGQ
ncbi:TPA: DUF4019 domain-containing protein [Vibrio parahaemolyticus]|uniref:DUF4019 domain-containing protein n=1 Tax=Vibrio parahaemolyticus TaxID=670 RepID=UPI0014597758|nr:DUF4019 domain-containing protein [Vibrio parahaemolyticus]EJB8535508.1 DUF4019 domain-containing protein [Vibrio parahaemolyticus]EJE4188932.1 DUF4019 domain-containing protein [Vibrio parahaemolyticus]ELC3210207.1 DUF4019 domain-containing protein [Vibrio parahaemolyticus]MBE3709871.1 DUF4019 domain-containing protein [Vibrio parahaemolyticus]MBE3919655.1 DUF4019 domain-containing protein [Vibrio parahaemolyticus]